ncbi:putative hydroxypyruvate isomerase [Halotydeus destructor]|nr:putative hydroxypyruvate isomerase [Halotydeus destructor]
MKFAANLSTLCQDIPKLTDRLCHLLSRKDYKFTNFECQNPYTVSTEEWKSAIGDSQVNWVLINSIPLLEAYPDIHSVPSHDEYKANILDKAIEYAKAFGLKRVHLVMKDIEGPEQIPEIVDLLKFAAQELGANGITGLIEPLAIRPHYYLRSYDLAIDIVEQVNSPNLKVMLDIFHLQQLHGNLTARIKTILPHTGHVQISQVPLRNCPMMSGEVNYGYVLKQLSRSYDDVIGLEFNNESVESFSWLNDFN